MKNETNKVFGFSLGHANLNRSNHARRIVCRSCDCRSCNRFARTSSASQSPISCPIARLKHDVRRQPAAHRQTDKRRQQCDEEPPYVENLQSASIVLFWGAIFLGDESKKGTVGGEFGLDSPERDHVKLTKHCRNSAFVSRSATIQKYLLREQRSTACRTWCAR
jgi:hypothetical protein